MAETSKNKIYYNDNEDSIADVLEDMKKLAESTDNAIEKAKYNDTELKNKNTAQDEEIAQIKEKDTTQDSLIEQLQAENTKLKKEINSMQIPGEATGNPIHLTDSSDMECEIVPIGNAEQETRSGKNKYNATINKTVNNVSSIADIQYFTLNGTSSTDGRVSFGLQTLKAGTYTVNLKCISGSYSNSANYPDHILKIWKGDSWNTFGTTINVNSTDKSQVSMTFTLEEDTEISLGTYYRATDIYNNIKYAYQIVEGSNPDFDFEPYGAMPSPEFKSQVKTVGQNGSVEIEVCNKNLAKINETNWELTENNTIKNKTRNNGADLATIKIKKGSTAKICLKLFSKPTAATTFICWLDSETQASKSFINFNGYNLNKIYINSITAEKDIEIRYQNSGNANSEIFEFQFWAEIDEATDYIPHESYTKVLPIQKEFVKIGDVEDTFVKVDGKWYEKHNIKKLTLDGTESWNWHSDGFGFTKAAGISIVPNDKVLAISNFLLGIQIGSNGTYYKDKDNVIFSWMSGNLICLKATNKFTDVETLKSWLAEQYANGTPVIVYYILAEAELIECTEEQSAILNSFYTYKGITNISVDGIGTLKVNYKKDLETLFNNINSALLS